MDITITLDANQVKGMELYATFIGAISTQQAVEKLVQHTSEDFVRRSYKESIVGAKTITNMVDELNA